MSIKQSEVAEDLGKLFEAACVELPMAAAKRMFGDQEDNAVRDAGWKAYDSWVRLANDASNRMYANPTFGTLAGRGIQAGLQVTRVVDAVASAIFGNLWPAIGLPTALELQALRSDVKALREELRTVVVEAGRASANDESDDARDDDAYAAARGAEAGNESAEIIWNGYKPAPKRKAKEGKKSVAL
jgi:hypothetical protein